MNEHMSLSFALSSRFRRPPTRSLGMFPIQCGWSTLQTKMLFNSRKTRRSYKFSVSPQGRTPSPKHVRLANVLFRRRVANTIKTCAFRLKKNGRTCSNTCSNTCSRMAADVKTHAQTHAEHILKHMLCVSFFSKPPGFARSPAGALHVLQRCRRGASHMLTHVPRWISSG